MVPCFFGAALLLAGCPSQDDALGEEGHAGGNDANVSDQRQVTCEKDGRSYQVGDSIPLNTCTTCVCQPDGTVGLCTGLCSPDAATQNDIVVTCTQNGTSYQIGATVVLNACTSCVCQKDGSLGMCTGLCPPDAATQNDAPVTCSKDGTTYQVGDIIRTSACASCVCQKDGSIGMCTGDCPPDAATDAAGTCTLDGKTYPVGTRVGGCVSCACQADGTWGMCTGYCPQTDARTSPDTDNSPAGQCTRTHGQVVTAQCCQSTGDFPNTCLDGPCGCSSSNSHTVSSCSCPAGTCFDPAKGCVGIPNVCTPGQDQTCNADPTSSALLGFCGDDGSCLCIAGTTRQANGKCYKP